MAGDGGGGWERQQEIARLQAQQQLLSQLSQGGNQTPQSPPTGGVQVDPNNPNVNPANPTGQLPNPTGYLTPYNSYYDDDALQDAWVPGAVEAAEIYNYGASQYDPNGYLAQTQQNLANPNNPFLNGLQGFNAQNPYAQQLGSSAAPNPYTNQLAGTNTQNPFTSAFQNFNPQNAATQGFQNFQSQANPYADQLFNQGADQIRDQINSQFGRSGHGSSSPNFDNQLNDLSKFGANFYGGIYDADQNRQLQALQGLSSASQGDNAQRLAALSGGAGAYSTGVGQGINALQGAGNMHNTSAGQNINALQGAGNLQQGANQLNLSALGAGSSGFQNQLAQAGSLLPGLAANEQQQPWQNLQNYSNIVSQLTGSARPNTSEPEASGFDQLLGLGALAGGLYSGGGLGGIFG